jgi:hypothetical protein
MRTYTNQTISWLMHSCSTFVAWTSHGQTRTHKIHHGPYLGEATTFPFVVYSMSGHGANTQMSFCSRTPRKLGVLQLWSPITLCADLQLRGSLKQNCSPYQELSNDMWHATFTQGNEGDSWFLMVGNQILPIWFPTFLLAITYVLITQMGHASPF